MGNILGRSNTVRRTKLLLELLVIYYTINKVQLDPSSSTSRILSRLDSSLKGYKPWQVVLGTLGVTHLLNNFSFMLGLNAPHRSLRSGPELKYSPSYSRVRWFLTAFDAGVVSTQHIKVSAIRDTLSFIMGLYYLVFSRKAEEKVNRFQAQVTPELIRAMWQKGQHPVLKFFSGLLEPKLPINGREVHVPRKDGSLIRCVLFFNGTDEQLRRASSLVLQFPGGGFIAMGPEDHASYLKVIARELSVPILSVDYRKAPRDPYPAQLLDCYQTYESIVSTNGKAIGINLGGHPIESREHIDPNELERPRLKLALMGDSAGGNLAMAVTLRALVAGLRLPDGLHMIYPCLELAPTMWVPQKHVVKDPETGALRARPGHSAILQAFPEQNKVTEAMQETKQSLSQQDQPEISPHPIMDSGSSLHYGGRVAANYASDETVTTLHPPEMSSRYKFASDAVLPFRYQLMIGRALLRAGGDPTKDMYISPLLAPDALLAKFPPTYVHVGQVDPLVDDSVILCERLRKLNPKQIVRLEIIPGVSHAYMNVTTLLPEGRQALQRSIEWLSEIFTNAGEKPRVNLLPSQL